MPDQAADRLPDHADVKVPPPLLYAAVLGLGLLLQRVVPLPPLPRAVTRPLGAGCIAGWAGLAAWAFASFRRTGTSFLPVRPATALLTDGPFRFTRNPLYISLALLYLGIALWLGALWPIALFPMLILLVQRAVIIREERYLERRFGDEYRAYRGRVRRWL